MISEIRDSQHKEALVQNLGVFELRGLAREMGIPSPTTKKRDELVSLILEGFRAGGVAETKVQKRGRPYKKLTSLEEIVNSVIIPQPNGDISYDHIVSFAQEETLNLTVLGDDVIAFDGIVRKTNKMTAINVINSSAVILVEDISFAEKLENGDFVTVAAQKTAKENCYKAVEIETINDVQACIYERKAFNHGEEIISQNKILLSDGDAYIGRRNAKCLDEDLYESHFVQEIASYCKLNGATLVLLGLNTSYENQILFKQIGVKFNFTTPYDTEPSINLNKMIDGLNLAENLFEQGKETVVVVTDLGATLLALDENFEGRESGHAKESKIIAKKLLSLAGAYSQGGQMSIIAFYNCVDEKDDFIAGDLLRICKKM